MKKIKTYLLTALLLISLPQDSLYARTIHVPDLEKRMKKIKTITVMPVYTVINRIDLGRTFKKMKKKSRKASLSIQNNVTWKIKKFTNFRVTKFKESKLTKSKKELNKQTLLMLDLLMANARKHSGWLTAEPFNELEDNFNYTLGKEVIKHSPKSDALLFVIAYDEYGTEGYDIERKRQHLNAALSNTILIGIDDDISLEFAIVERKTGDILWYDSYFYMNNREDITDKEVLSEMIYPLLYRFPGIINERLEEIE